MVGADYTPAQVAELLAQGNVQLVDVRTPREREAGRIDGDRHIELGELTAQADTIDASRPVILYCRSGSRSAMAAKALSLAGFDAHNMAGGMIDWATAGLPMVPDGAYVA